MAFLGVGGIEIQWYVERNSFAIYWRNDGVGDKVYMRFLGEPVCSVFWK